MMFFCFVLVWVISVANQCVFKRWVKGEDNCQQRRGSAVQCLLSMMLQLQRGQYARLFEASMQQCEASADFASCHSLRKLERCWHCM